MKNYQVIVITRDDSAHMVVAYRDFEDDIKNRRVIIRQVINDNMLVKTIIPYENIRKIIFREVSK